MKQIVKKIITSILTAEARLILRRHRPTLVGITGGVGKTSSKDAVYAVVKHFVGVARKSEKSYNSETGTPLTIIGLASPFGGLASVFRWLRIILKGMKAAVFDLNYPQWLILEIGADRPGDIKNNLARWLNFRLVILTTLPTIPPHVEFFPTPEMVWEEKLSLLTALEKDGLVIFNADDQRLLEYIPRVKRRFLTYGFTDQADLSVGDYQLIYRNDYLAGINFKIKCAGHVLPVRLIGTAGRQHVYPVLAALAVAQAENWNLLEAVKILEEIAPTPGRCRLLSGIKGTTLIDDSYNSSPAALDVALDILAEAKIKGRKIAVLGDMLELGNFTISAHEEAGKKVAEIVDELYLVGLRAKFIGEAAEQAGLSKDKIHYFDDSVIAGQKIAVILESNDLVLIKGSQAIRLEKTVKEIMAEPERASELLVRQDEEWLKR